MGPSHSWFYGHLLEPVNQAINTTTDLTVESLTATDINASTINTSLINVSNVSATDITIDTIDGITANISTINSSTCNASEGVFPALTTITINTIYANSQVYNTSSLNASEIYADGLITDGNMSCVELEADTINCSTTNISTANISTLNVSDFGTTNNLVGKSANYGRQRTTELDPPDADTVVYYDFNTESYANADLFTYTTPIASSTSGFRCLKAGWYRFQYSIHVLSKYGDRVQWLTRPILNNTPTTIGYGYAYTRGANYQFAWEGNCTSGGLIEFAVDDYFKIDALVAKSDNTFGDTFQYLVFGISNTISFEYLGV